MTNKDIETIRNCLNVLETLPYVELDGQMYDAIIRYCNETMDEILRPLYPKPEAVAAQAPTAESP